jgi:uncharacterized glyoxalase superfamily protein PhnB
VQINPYIIFNGNTGEVFNFYISVFGEEFATILRFKDLASTEFQVTENEGLQIPLGGRVKARIISLLLMRSLR